jgi:hypothetical protein
MDRDGWRSPVTFSAVPMTELETSCDLIYSPVRQRLKIPTSTVTDFQTIKFGEGNGLWEIYGPEFVGINHEGGLIRWQKMYSKWTFYVVKLMRQIVT